MRVEWRRLAASETDAELLWLAISVSGALLLAIWFALKLPTPICAFHSLTGWPCLTCGATRCAVAFLHGHFETALLFNPLAFAVYCAVAAFDFYAALVLICRAPRLRLSRFDSGAKKILVRAAVALLLVNWSYLIVAGKV